MIAIDFESFRFASPVYLWLLVIPAALMVVWGWRVVRRRANVRRQRCLNQNAVDAAVRI